MTFVPDWFWLPESKWNALESKQAWKEARMRHIAKIEDPNTKDFIQEYLDTVSRGGQPLQTLPGTLRRQTTVRAFRKQTILGS